jgi:hypothetical protein
MEKKYFRECPLCQKMLGYTRKKNRNTAERKRQICGSCRSKEIQRRPEIILCKKKMGILFKEKYSGKGNPFYGKRHTEETKKKVAKTKASRDYPAYKTEEFKEKSRRLGKLNGMYGKTVYGVWIEKYGKEIADEKQGELSKKLSKNSSGKNNPMYGKPTPQGAGNGWSGWYKGWFFRSLKELSYLIKEIEGKNKKWRTAETKDLRIEYIDYKGDQRTYTADFLVEEKELIEVKPSKLKKSLTVRLKAKAARKFCKRIGLVYKIKDVKVILEKDIKKMYENKVIKFTKKYEEMYKIRYCDS